LFDRLRRDLLGTPAFVCAWREGICPSPARITWPMITCSICSGATPARSSAALIAMLPGSGAPTDASAPLSLAMGVRASERITVLGMLSPCVGGIDGRSGFASRT